MCLESSHTLLYSTVDEGVAHISPSLGAHLVGREPGIISHTPVHYCRAGYDSQPTSTSREDGGMQVGTHLIALCTVLYRRVCLASHLHQEYSWLYVRQYSVQTLLNHSILLRGVVRDLIITKDLKKLESVQKGIMISDMIQKTKCFKKTSHFFPCDHVNTTPLSGPGGCACPKFLTLSSLKRPKLFQ